MFAKTLTIAALAAAAAAQNSTAAPYNVTYLQGLAGFLATMNLTSLASAVTMSINSTGTLNLLKNINGTGKTLLAPTNTAFTGFATKFPNSSNAEFVGDVLSYHLIDGTLNSTLFSTAPNHTIARTAMTDPAVVQLEGGFPQAIVFAVEDNVTHVLNQNTNVTITNTTSYQDLLIYIVDSVVDIPGNFSTAIGTYQLTAASTVLTQLNFTAPINAAKGFTIFVPDNDAFAAAQSTLTSLMSSNITAVQDAVSNHVINGSTIYSTQLGSASATSIAGEPFTFASNSSGTFVTSGNSTAKVVVADVLLDNGVMHIIDTVLLNTQDNLGAAASAYSSATSVAATAATASATGPIGNNVGTSGSGTGSSGSSSSTTKSAAGRTVPIFTGANALQAAVVLAGVFAGAAVLI
ncbi:hypothetical protein FRB96_000608 [Tulasnella sp. 330]|nr:hypothetical protein FRB96_000608 [Tulasnella sp. 330]KAG8880333.1 hypothetical protein FRB98_005182 [Tulasnella sp. 332]